MNKSIRIGKETVPVSEEIYKEYYKMARRERYMQNDIKVGRIDVDMGNEKVAFIESKEDSINRLIDQGVDFANEVLIEDVICDKALVLILQQAFSELDRQEKELIQDIYYKKKLPVKLQNKKKFHMLLWLKGIKRFWTSLKNFLHKFGYQTALPVG